MVSSRQSAVKACELGVAWSWLFSAVLNFHIIRYKGDEMEAPFPNLKSIATSEQDIIWATSY